MSELLSNYKDYIRAWQLSCHRPSKVKCYFRFQKGEAIFEKTDYCNQFVDQIIRSCQLSDFDLLQIEWSASIPKLEELITTLTEESHGSRLGKIEGLAKKTVLLVKLIRTLINKISNPWKKKSITFRLDTELNSTTLSRLHDPPHFISSDFKLVTQILLGSSRSNELRNNGGGRDEQFRSDQIRTLVINKISKTVNNFITLLVSNLVPIDHDFDPLSLESNYMLWVRTWKHIWDSALCDFLNDLAEIDEEEDGHEEEDDDDEDDTQG
ncbi:hypothetical protein KEM48_008237 [Puccinia striiformis f. sp. tritici PST-130]|nr:hypothetical protein KEM48_008237 [Puccinia striiformis f. sp. tritici PST-130]